MPFLEPVPWDDLDPELRDLMTRGRQSGMLSTTVPHQVLGYRPELAAEHLRLYSKMFDDAILEPRLRELVRLRIASLNDCDACKLARKSDEVTEADLACLDSSHEGFSPRERAALRFAELLVEDHFAIDAAVFTELSCHFSAPEIVELGLFAVTMLGSGRLVYALRAYPTDDHLPIVPYRSGS